MTGDKSMGSGGASEENLSSCTDESCCPPQDNAMPFVRSGQKIGRNDPCFCASGLKFKKCCGKAA